MKKSDKFNRHEHSGKSSVAFLDATEVLELIGLKKGQIVVDIGSGAGYFSLAAVATVGTGGTVYAIDVDGEAIVTLNEMIREQNISNLKALQEDVSRQISVPKSSVDVCLMVNVLHGFVANGEIDDVFRVLEPVWKEGAKLIVIDFKKELSSPGPPQEIRLSPKDIESLLDRYQFVSERIFDAGPFHFAHVLKKENQADFRR